MTSNTLAIANLSELTSEYTIKTKKINFSKLRISSHNNPISLCPRRQIHKGFVSILSKSRGTGRADHRSAGTHAHANAPGRAEG